MASKLQLLVITVFSLIFACRYTGIDSDLLDEGEVKASSSWRMVDFFLFAADTERKHGEIELHISEHLVQKHKLRAVSVQFSSRATIIFSAPDPTSNEAQPDSDSGLINSADIKLFDQQQQSICPEHDIVADLARNTEQESRDKLIFMAMELACGGNKIAEMNNIATSIDALAAVPATTWLKEYEETVAVADKFYQEEKEKGEAGVLHKSEDDSDTNAVIDNFLIKRKMIKGFAALRKELKTNNVDLGNMRSGEHQDKHVVIPATLNAFLNASVNNRVSPDDEIADNNDIDAMLMKEALGGAVAKFLLYDHMFQSDAIFDSANSKQKFSEIKNKLAGSRNLQQYVEDIETRFNNNKTAQDKIYNSTAKISIALYDRLTCINKVLMNKKAEGHTCEKIIDEFYSLLVAPICDDKKIEDSDVLILLTSRSIMKKTNIHNPCKDYAIKIDKFDDESNKLISEGVTSMKRAVLDSMDDMIKIYGGSDFRRKMLQKHYYAAVPVITEYPDKASDLAGVLAEAHQNEYKKRKTDEFWQGFLEKVQWVAGALGIVSLILLFFPPAWVVVGGLTSLTAALAIGGGVFLAVSHSADYINERRDYTTVERAIYSGGQGDIGQLADNLKEWHQAKQSAIIEGVLTFGGVAKIGRVVTNPQAFRSTYSVSRQGLKELGKDVGQSIQGTIKVVRHPKSSLAILRDKLRDRWRMASNIVKNTPVTTRAANLKGVLNDITTSLKTGVSNAVRNNLRAWRASDDVKALRNLRKSVGGKGRYGVEKNGGLYFKAKRGALTPEDTKEVEAAFAELRGMRKAGDWQFSRSGVGEFDTYRLIPKANL